MYGLYLEFVLHTSMQIHRSKPMKYLPKEEFEEWKDSDFKELKDSVEDIKENHLASIWLAIQFVMRDVGNLRWFIIGSVAVLGIVLALLEVFG